MPMRLSPYFRLMRLHQPVGIWLLVWPCWWSLALASPELPSIRLLFLFGLGAILMRSAGCIINDIADRDIDRRVERTRTRPLASGELSLTQAVALLGILLLAAFGVAMALGDAVMLWAVLALVPVGIYPFMKRISWWPQLFLGFTFNWGVLMGWAAVRGTIEWPAVILYIGSIFWTLGYDTIYAHQDKEDDARIGVKSTALHFGDKTKRMLGLFYLLAIVFWMNAGLMVEGNIMFFLIMLFAELQLGWQICNVDLDDPASCRFIFISNIWTGWLLFAAFILGRF